MAPVAGERFSRRTMFTQPLVLFLYFLFSTAPCFKCHFHIYLTSLFQVNLKCCISSLSDFFFSIPSIPLSTYSTMWQYIHKAMGEVHAPSGMDSSGCVAWDIIPLALSACMSAIVVSDAPQIPHLSSVNKTHAAQIRSLCLNTHSCRFLILLLSPHLYRLRIVQSDIIRDVAWDYQLSKFSLIMYIWSKVFFGLQYWKVFYLYYTLIDISPLNITLFLIKISPSSLEIHKNFEKCNVKKNKPWSPLSRSTPKTLLLSWVFIVIRPVLFA